MNEQCYHGFMVGLLSQSQKYLVKSNRESGDGRNDVMLYPLDLEKKAFILEFKASKKFKKAMEDAEKAVEQIRDKYYGPELENMGYEAIDMYGIAFFRKNCKVCYGGGYKKP